MVQLQSLKDVSTVTSQGVLKRTLIEGVTLQPLVTHIDERGSLLEVNNENWAFNAGIHIPCVSMYSIRPGKVKGWVVHREQIDRNFLCRGTVKWVLYDDRAASSTYGKINEIVVSQYDRTLMMIPNGVYHAVQNIGDEEAVLVDMPSVPYNHEDPDKYRLPLDTDLIPYRFEIKLGW